MLGVFRATCWPQQNIEPLAWAEEGTRGGSRFPLQVRVRLDTPTVLVLSEDQVRSALEYRGSLARFDLQMSKEAASALALLFQQIGEPRPPQQHAAIGMSLGRPKGDPSLGAAGGARLSGERGERTRRNGLVFICDPTTEKECLQRRLLGLPKSQSSLLSKLADTSLLFLFNVRTRLMLGVFTPDGPAGMEIEPNAWGGGGRFPVQVRFKPVNPSGQVLQVPETALGEVLRYRNASTRFDLLLRGRAVDKIIGIFAQRGTPVGGMGESSGVPPSVPIYGGETAAFAGESLPSPTSSQASSAAAPQGPPAPLPGQPPLPPMPPPPLPPLPPEAAPPWQEAGSPAAMPPLPPLPPQPASGPPDESAAAGGSAAADAAGPAAAPAAPPSSAAAEGGAPTAALAVSSEPTAPAEAAGGGEAPLESVLGSLSIASGGSSPGTAPPSLT